jgi:hypothetical protein
MNPMCDRGLAGSLKLLPHISGSFGLVENQNSFGGDQIGLAIKISINFESRNL